MNGNTGSSDKPSCLRGICPYGWHVPSDAEWTELTDYVSSQPYYRCDGYPTAIAKALASSTGWVTTSGDCNIGGDTSTNNRTGFSVVPAGSNENNYFFGNRAYFWTATPHPDYSPSYSWDREAFYRQFSNNHSYIDVNNDQYYYNLPSFSEGYSVRCVRDTVCSPTVTTGAISDSSTNAAVCNGNVLYSGGSYVIDKGFCWDTVPNPTLSNNTSGSVSVIHHTGTAAEPSSNAGAESQRQTGFVASYDFLPGQGSTLSGSYTNSEDYQNGVHTRGSSTSVSMGLGSYTYTVMGLQPGTTYYVRAYAINAAGTAYGNNVSFTTLPVPAGDAVPCPGTPTVTDYDGNVYNTVQIGAQCWMKENLRTTHFADGTSIPAGGSYDTSTVVPRRYGNVVSNYGYLYNFPATMHGTMGSSNNPSGLQGICPDGWHVPSMAEWTQLTTYVSGQNEYIFDQDATHISKSLASQTGWTSGNSSNIIGNDAYKNDATGFSASPAGYFTRYSSQFTIRDVGTNAFFWSSSTPSSGYQSSISANALYLNNNVSAPYTTNTFYKYYGLSVRCVKGVGYNTPGVTTSAVHSITDTTAVVGGVVTHTGGDATVVRGVCWSNSGTPTLQDQHIACGSGIGAFSTTMTNLSDNVVYYVRAYATNQLGTVYGETKMFRKFFPVPAGDAQPCPGMATVTDVDGNVYNTVQIGDQCWTKENLRTRHYAGGASIALGNTVSGTIPYCYAPDDNMGNVATYGYLYNWPAVMNLGSAQSNSHDICPAGWHVPSEGEWIQLLNHVGNDNGVGFPGYWYNYIYVAPAKALSSKFGWPPSSIEGSPGFDTLSNNASEFSALPAGMKTHSIGSYFESIASFWSKTDQGMYDSTYARSLRFSYDNPPTNLSNYYMYYQKKEVGLSVRCLKTTSPRVTTGTVQKVDNNRALATGNIVADGGVPVTACGFCWSTSHNPTVADNHTVDSLNDGSFTSILTNLSNNTTYFIRAYATNSEGTAYGDELMLTYSGFYCGNTAMMDIDGNLYNTVQIGDQCWMKENLRTTRYSDGTVIPAGTSSSATAPYRYAPNNNTNNVSTYGYLYNWPAVMHGAASSYSIPSGVQGVCPTGWHVPSDSEWTKLTNYVSSQSEYVCGTNNSYIAKALAYNYNWNSSNNTCAVGNNQGYNNATGFSARPAGYFYNNSYSLFGSCGTYFSASDLGGPALRNFEYNKAYVQVAYAGSGMQAYSVRCLRDTNGISSTETCTSISELRSKMGFLDISMNQEDTTEYHLAGNVVVTAQTAFNNQKIIQDATGAIYVYDPENKLNSLEVGDKVCDLYGTLNNYYGFLEFRPTRPYGNLEAIFQMVAPLTVTLSQLNDTAFMNQHQAELVQLNNVTITSSGNFTRRHSYVLSQNNTVSSALYVLWPDHDYLNMTIPTGVSMNIKGFVYRTGIDYGSSSSYGEYRYYIVPRSLDDMQPVGGGN